MLSVRSIVAFLAAVALFSAAEPAAAFAPTASSRSSSSSNAGRAATSLYVMGPKQAAAMEKLKNPAKYEQTIQGLMAQKGLTRGQAEKRYGEFLADPDGACVRACVRASCLRKLGQAMFAGNLPVNRVTHNRVVFFHTCCSF